MKSSGRNSSSTSHCGRRNDSCGASGRQRMHGIVAARLQEDREAMFGAGRTRSSLRLVGIAQRLQVAEHQRDREIIAGDELDLRDVAHAPSRPSTSADQRGDLARRSAAPPRGIRAMSATKRGSCFAEADQGLVLLLDAAHREPPLAPVAPAVAGQRRQHRLRRTWPMRCRLSSSTLLLGFDLLVFGARCCSTQPPQVPKCGQRGVTRSGDACTTSRVFASSKCATARSAGPSRFRPARRRSRTRSCRHAHGRRANAPRRDRHGSG
jgi:hypothetical protein